MALFVVGFGVQVGLMGREWEEEELRAKKMVSCFSIAFFFFLGGGLSASPHSLFLPWFFIYFDPMIKTLTQHPSPENRRRTVNEMGPYHQPLL